MWNLSENSAVWRSTKLSVQVDLLRPGLGLHELQVQGERISHAHLLAIEQPGSPGDEALVDSYVRGCDLVATFAQFTSRPLCPQIYWRALPIERDFDLGGFELIVSAQTNLLDVDPSFTTSSVLPCGQMLRMISADLGRFEPLPDQPDTTIERGPGVFLIRPSFATWSYAEMIFPTDFAGARVATDQAATGAMRLTNLLFPERLEKGVIRRGRIRGAFLPRVDDESWAASAYDSFVASPLPLTT